MNFKQGMQKELVKANMHLNLAVSHRKLILLIS